MKLNQYYPINFGGERKIYFKYISLHRSPAIRHTIAQ